MQHHQVEGIALLLAQGEEIGHVHIHRHANVRVGHVAKIVEVIQLGIGGHVDALHDAYQVCLASRTMVGSTLFTSGEAVMAME